MKLRKGKMQEPMLSKQRRATAWPSLDLHVGGLDDLFSLGELFALEGAEGGGRHLLRRRQVLAEILHAAADVGVLQRRDRRSIELGDDLRRRALGRPQAVPDRDFHAGIAGLGRGRNFGRRW